MDTAQTPGIMFSLSLAGLESSSYQHEGGCWHTQAARYTFPSSTCPSVVNIGPQSKPGMCHAGAFAGRQAPQPLGHGHDSPVCVFWEAGLLGLRGDKLVEREVTKSREPSLPASLLKMSPPGLPEGSASIRCLSSIWRGTRSSGCPFLLVGENCG